MGTAQVLCARPFSGRVGVGGRCWGSGARGEQGDGGDAGHTGDGSEGSKDPEGEGRCCGSLPAPSGEFSGSDGGVSVSNSQMRHLYAWLGSWKGLLEA